MNSPDFTEKYYNRIIESRQQTIKRTKNEKISKQIQKNNFKLISNLVSELFQNKSSKDSYQTLSNLIVVLLNFQTPKHPLDVFSSESINDKVDDIHREALKKEFIADTLIYNNIRAKEQNIIEIFKRVFERYDTIANIEFCPKLRNN